MVNLPIADDLATPALTQGVWLADIAALTTAAALPQSTEQERTARAAAIEAALQLQTLADVRAILNIPSFTRYASEAALPARVPDGVVAWVPRS